MLRSHLLCRLGIPIYYFILIYIGCNRYASIESFRHLPKLRAHRLAKNSLKVAISATTASPPNLVKTFSQSNDGNNKNFRIEVAQSKLSAFFRLKGLDIATSCDQIVSDVESIAPDLSAAELTFLMQNFQLLQLPKQSKVKTSYDIS
ncbi:hypothetical protein EON65_05240 [archaeon]|nr:MAG: hypothetical protein EON65_05240 [archaeon]